MTEAEEDWCEACSDDENYGFVVEQDQVLPKTKDIIELYNKLAKGEKLTLEWQCIGKRPPTPEAEESSLKQEMEEEQVEETKAEVTEFDFDEGEFDANPITPKRTPGSTKTPKTQKRVARLDKIMNDMVRHKHLQAPGASQNKS